MEKEGKENRMRKERFGENKIEKRKGKEKTNRKGKTEMGKNQSIIPCRLDKVADEEPDRKTGLQETNKGEGKGKREIYL